MTYLRLTKARFEAFVLIIKAILILIQKMYTSDVKFSWRSFSRFAIDLKSLTKIEMCILTKVVWAAKFSSFLTLTYNSLIFCFRLKLSSEIKRFSSRCSLRKKCRRCSRDRCRSTFSYVYLKNIDFFRSCIITWCAWIWSVLRSSVADLCTKRSCRRNDDFFWNIVNIDWFSWFYWLIIAISLRLIFWCCRWT